MKEVGAKKKERKERKKKEKKKKNPAKSHSGTSPFLGFPAHCRGSITVVALCILYGPG